MRKWREAGANGGVMKKAPSPYVGRSVPSETMCRADWWLGETEGFGVGEGEEPGFGGEVAVDTERPVVRELAASDSD
jgi:hypothetical protein